MSMICIHLANNINFSILDRESIENLWETNNIFNNNFVALYNVMSKTNVIYSSENEPTIFLIWTLDLNAYIIYHLKQGIPSKVQKSSCTYGL